MNRLESPILPEPPRLTVPDDQNYRYPDEISVDPVWLNALLMEKPKIFHAHIMLMMAAWNQSPKGSLPNQMNTIRVLSGMSSSPQLFEKSVDSLMANFILCSDNRFYHQPLINALSNDIAQERSKYEHQIRRSEAGKIAAKSRWERKNSKNIREASLPSVPEIKDMFPSLPAPRRVESALEEIPVTTMAPVVEKAETTTESEGKRPKVKPKKSSAARDALLALDLHGIISIELWTSFVDHRLNMHAETKKNPFTVQAARVALNRLKRYYEEDHLDPVDIVEVSIANSWLSLYPDRFKPKKVIQKINLEWGDEDDDSDTVSSL